jgi:excisionase family DNA binding protein
MPDDLTVAPSHQELPRLRQLSTAMAAAETVCLQFDGREPLRLPPSAREGVVRVLAALAHGTPVVINPVDELMTTQEAADFLGVSRPHLVALLERGEIPYQRAGDERSHRRVALRDILEYASAIGSRRAPASARAARVATSG